MASLKSVDIVRTTPLNSLPHVKAAKLLVRSDIVPVEYKESRLCEFSMRSNVI